MESQTEAGLTEREKKKKRLAYIIENLGTTALQLS
jgi:hypothetical protein